MKQKMTAEQFVNMGTRALDEFAQCENNLSSAPKNQLLNTAIIHYTAAIELESKNGIAHFMRGTVFDEQEMRLDAFFDYTVAIHSNQLSSKDAVT